MARKSLPYEDDLMAWLQDPAHAAEYINAAIEDGDREVFLLALRGVAVAEVERVTDRNSRKLFRLGDTFEG